jgi:hypothetical protein
MGNLEYRWEGTVSSEAVLERVVASGRACQAAQGWRGRGTGYSRLTPEVDLCHGKQPQPVRRSRTVQEVSFCVLGAGRHPPLAASPRGMQRRCGASPCACADLAAQATEGGDIERGYSSNTSGPNQADTTPAEAWAWVSELVPHVIVARAQINSFTRSSEPPVQFSSTSLTR